MQLVDVRFCALSGTNFGSDRCANVCFDACTLYLVLQSRHHRQFAAARQYASKLLVVVFKLQPRRQTKWATADARRKVVCLRRITHQCYRQFFLMSAVTDVHPKQDQAASVVRCTAKLNLKHKKL